MPFANADAGSLSRIAWVDGRLSDTRRFSLTSTTSPAKKISAVASKVSVGASARQFFFVGDPLEIKR
jgi:hypothetical protein